MRDQVSSEYEIVEMRSATVVVCYPRPMPTDPDELARLRARYEEVSKWWHPGCLGSTSDQIRMLPRVAKERVWLRRQIEAGEREEREQGQS